MAKPLEKAQAFELRRAGESIKEIAERLNVSSKTVSNWVRDLELTEEQREDLHKRQIASGHKGRMIGAAMNRDKKLERTRIAHDEAIVSIPNVSTDALFFLGLGLYWGEGAKTENSSLAVSNSDPRAIKLMIRWFVECLQVEMDRFMPRVFISDTHRDREEIILEFWSKELNLPRTQFKKTVYLNRGKKIYENHNMYYGVLALRVSKGGNIRTKILAYIDRVAEV